MFGLLSDGVKSLGFHTALLESCDWDENQCDQVIKKTTDYFNNLKLPDIPCDYNFFVDNVVRDGLLKENIAEEQVNLIIKFVHQNAKYVAKILSLPEN